MKQNRKLIREQLDAALKRFTPLRDVNAPPKGWIRAIRLALGMSAKQLALRLGVTQQAVSRVEKDEQSGSASIKTMRRIAERLDCVFVYGFVPRTSLTDTVTRRARHVAQERLERVGRTMELENQGLSSVEYNKAFADMVDEIVRTTPATLWARR